MVFEAACEAGGEQGRAAAGQLPYVRAVMETAISASVGHRNVVRALWHLSARALLARVRTSTAPQSHHAHAQVATYHYDIKRMDDQPDSGGLQVRVGAAEQRSRLWKHACGRAECARFASLVLQVVPGDDASLEVAPQAAVAAGVQAFKVFLVQVRPLFPSKIRSLIV